MKIQCPECSLTGNVDDSLVPATGITMNCPRCKARFTVERQQVSPEQASYMVDTCPSCQYSTFSEEKFSVCPQCSLVVADYRRQLSASKGGERRGNRAAVDPPQLTAEQKRRDDESRKKYGLGEPEAMPEVESETGILKPDIPFQIQLAGWATIVISVLLLLYGGSGFLDYMSKLQEAAAALLAGDEVPSGFSLFWRFAIIPLLMICYAISMAAVAGRFLALRPWTIRWLEIGGWSGVALGALTELVEMAAWCSRASGDATVGYYATGLMGSAMMALLWMFPPFVLVEYLRSEQFDRERKKFS